MWAIKAKVKTCGWDVTDLLDGNDYDAVTGLSRRGGGLELAKYPARLLRHRLDQWGTRTPSGRIKTANY